MGLMSGMTGFRWWIAQECHQNMTDCKVDMTITTRTEPRRSRRRPLWPSVATPAQPTAPALNHSIFQRCLNSP